MRHVVCRDRKISATSSVVEFYQGELFGQAVFIEAASGYLLERSR